MVESFLKFREKEDELNEALITFGGKAYPNFGHFLILAGGGGSGKGFVKDKLIGLTGKSIDVDHIKELAIASTKFSAKIKEETGHDIKSFDLRKSENVSKIHEILGSMYKTDKKLMSTFSKSILLATPDRKPNIIMDVTLKDMKKMKDLSKWAEELGYAKSNIHLVWVVNDVEVAVSQNAGRPRVVPVDILIGTHEGAANTMKEILSMGMAINRYLDGDIVLAFNKYKIDSTEVNSKSGGSYLKDVNYVYMKRTGKPMISVNDMEQEIYAKIKSYVPKGTTWDKNENVLEGTIAESTDLFGI